MHDFTVHLSGKHTAVNINITYSHTNIREKTAKEEEKKTLWLHTVAKTTRISLKVLENKSRCLYEFKLFFSVTLFPDDSFIRTRRSRDSAL